MFRFLSITVLLSFFDPTAARFNKKAIRNAVKLAASNIASKSHHIGSASLIGGSKKSTIDSQRLRHTWVPEIHNRQSRQSEAEADAADVWSKLNRGRISTDSRSQKTNSSTHPNVLNAVSTLLQAYVAGAADMLSKPQTKGYYMDTSSTTSKDPSMRSAFSNTHLLNSFDSARQYSTTRDPPTGDGLDNHYRQTFCDVDLQPDSWEAADSWKHKVSAFEDGDYKKEDYKKGENSDSPDSSSSDSSSSSSDSSSSSSEDSDDSGAKVEKTGVSKYFKDPAVGPPYAPRTKNSSWNHKVAANENADYYKLRQKFMRDWYGEKEMLYRISSKKEKSAQEVITRSQINQGWE